jgi:septal ring factor EnvC (AmiA/AmiB activator)
MFGLLSRFRVYIIMAALFAGAAGVAYWYYQDSQNAIRQYIQNQAALTQALQTQQQAYAALQADLKLLQETQQQLIVEFSASRDRVRELEQTFAQSTGGQPRDIGKLAAAKPELVQKIVNTATHDVFRCFELLSGDTPKTEDLNNEDTSDCINSNTDTTSRLQQ